MTLMQSKDIKLSNFLFESVCVGGGGQTFKNVSVTIPNAYIISFCNKKVAGVWIDSVLKLGPPQFQVLNWVLINLPKSHVCDEEAV